MPRPPRFLSSRTPCIAGFLLLLIAGCAENPPISPPHSRSPDASPQSPRKVKLRIAAASDLKFVFVPFSEAFAKQHPEIELAPTFGSSGTFFAQLKQLAPFDVFLSADEKFPAQLIADDLADRNSLFQYGSGRLVLWTKLDSGLDVVQKKFLILQDPGVRHVAIANPRVAPYGRAAEQFLKNEKLWDSIQSKIVQAESASHTAQLTESGNAQLGLLPLALVKAGPLADKGQYWLIPSELHAPLNQSGVILKSSKNQLQAKAFCDFLVGEEAVQILKQFGLRTEDR